MSSNYSLGGVGGFNSGLDVNSIITQLMAIEHRPIDLMQQKKTTYSAQQTAFSNVQNKVNDLLSSIKTLSKRDFNGKSLFDSMAATTSDDKIATASVTSSATAQSLSLEVLALPSSTKATSTAGVGKFDTTMTMSDLGVTDGNFTIYEDGVAYNFAVTGTDTLSNVFKDIKNALPQVKVNPTIVDGKVNIAYNGSPSTQITFGAGGDSSNFLNKMFLSTAVDNGAGTITASQRVTTVDVMAVASSSAANLATPLTDGTFTINGVSFDTTGKSLVGIMDEINRSDAGVSASFNKGSNTFQLVAKDTGSPMISLADGTSNFLTAMHLISGTDTTSSQTAGTNAKFVLNGATMYATSTTVDETVTGITGVTLNLKQATPGTTVQIGVTKDTDAIVKAITDVVSKYNTAISFIDQQTKVDTTATSTDSTSNNGPLYKETSLKSLRNQLRGLFSVQISGLAGTAYDSLQLAGVSTGAIGSGSASTPSAQMKIDESKLRAALAADPDTVKKLFIGQDLQGTTSIGDDNVEGTFTKIKKLLSDQTYVDANGKTGYGVLYTGTSDSNKGLFAAYQASMQQKLKVLNDSIQRAEDRLTQREKTLRQQYLAMDKIVGQYQTQGSALTNLANSSNNN